MVRGKVSGIYENWGYAHRRKYGGFYFVLLMANYPRGRIPLEPLSLLLIHIYNQENILVPRHGRHIKA